MEIINNNNNFDENKQKNSIKNKFFNKNKQKNHKNNKNNLNNFNNNNQQIDNKYKDNINNNQQNHNKFKNKKLKNEQNDADNSNIKVNHKKKKNHNHKNKFNNNFDKNKEQNITVENIIIDNNSLEKNKQIKNNDLKRNKNKSKNNNKNNNEIESENNAIQNPEIQNSETQNEIANNQSEIVNANEVKQDFDGGQNQEDVAKTIPSEVSNMDDKIEVFGVRFDKGCRPTYFVPNGEKFQKGEKIMAETSTGLEIGTVALENFYIEKSKLSNEPTNIVRRATQEDLQKEQEFLKRAVEAKDLCKELAKNLNLDMKVVEVKFLFDSKVLFSFTSDNRVDFRELVKELANKLHARIEMRQIGARDETRCVGCYGMCGQECCCTRFLNDYEKTSVKMAKNQNIALNPTKINGVCGRLLCCLSYENEYYVETLKIMPKVGSNVKTPDGEGVVTYNNLLEKVVSVKIKTGEDSFELRQYPLEKVEFKDKNIIKDDDEDE